MKKLLALVMVLLLTFSLALVACDEVVEDGDGSNVIIDGDDNASVDEKVEATEDNTPADDNNKEENAPFDPATITPEKLYENIVKEMADVDNVTITAKQDINMTMTVGDQIIPVQTMNQVITQKYDKGNFSMVTTNNLVAGVNCQYVDGVVYNVQITDGAKIKYKASEEDLAALAGIDPNGAKIMNIPADWFKNCELKADEDGNGYYIEFVLNGEAYKELFSNFSLLESVKEVSDISHKVYVTAEGKIDSIVSTATMVVVVEGTEVVAEMVSVSSYGDIGSTVVEAPADADSYTTVDISQLK